MSDYSPLEIVKRSLNAWPLVALLVFLGGLAGLLVFSLRQPLYESRIEFTFSIDYARTGVLTDVEEDQALEAAGDVLGSSAVMEAVLSSAARQNISLTLAGLQSAAVRERSGSAWRVRIRRPDAREAAWLANAWGEQAEKALADAVGHAVAVDGLSRYLDALESCLSRSVASEPVQAACPYSQLSEIQSRLAETGAAIHKEKLASQGLMPGLGFQWTEKAVPAAKPAVYGRGSLILGGALMGFVLSIALAAGGRPFSLRKRGHV